MKFNKNLLVLILSTTLVIATGCENIKVLNNKKTDISSKDKNIEIAEGEDFEKTIIEVPEEDKTIIEVTEQDKTNAYVDTNDYGYLKENVKVFDSEYKDSNYVCDIDIYQKVFREKTNGEYDLIKYNNYEGYVTSDKIDVLPSKYVEVDIDSQNIKLYNNEDIIVDSSIVSGKDSTPTRTGYFDIKNKSYDTYLKGPGYRSHVYYWMPFDGGIGLHDALWRDTFGDNIYINKGSHGCVNLPLEVASTIYDNVDKGTKVLVHK